VPPRPTSLPPAQSLHRLGSNGSGSGQEEDCSGLGGHLMSLVHEVLKQRIIAPDDSLLLVCLRVFEICCLACLPAKQTMKVRSDFMTFARADRMAFSTARLEKMSSSLCVTRSVRHCCWTM